MVPRWRWLPGGFNVVLATTGRDSNQGVSALMRTTEIPKYLNLSLVALFPVAWCAPLIKTGLLPTLEAPWWLGGEWFKHAGISVISGLQALWEKDVFLAIAVTFFALVAPLLKCLGLALIDYGLLSKAVKPTIAILGKLAMADIFILALYVVVAKGIGIGEIEVAWGLYLFTGCVIVSLLLSIRDARRGDAQ